MLTPNRMAVVFVLALSFLVFLLKGQDPMPVSRDGRFQLVQGDYVAAVGSAGVPEKGVFRIDTATGKTWEFIMGIGTDKKLFREWRLVSE